MRVTKIEPGNLKTFDEAQGEIKKTLAQQRARAEIAKLRDKVDDQIGSGTALAEIAKNLKLPVQTVDAVDRSGRGPDGKPITLPAGAELLGGIFAANVNDENDAVQTQTAAPSGSMSTPLRRRATARSTRSRTSSRRAGTTSR